jgi:hypothetical protein
MEYVLLFFDKFTRKSARRPAQLPARHKVEMDMENRLTGARIVIGYNSETAFGKPLLPGKSGGDRIDMADQLMVGRFEIEGINKMFPRDNQKMEGRNRRNVFDDNHLVVFEDPGGGNFSLEYPAENAIFHGFLLIDSAD